MKLYGERASERGQSTKRKDVKNECAEATGVARVALLRVVKPNVQKKRRKQRQFLPSLSLMWS